MGPMLLSIDIGKPSIEVIHLPEGALETGMKEVVGEFRGNLSLFAIQGEKVHGQSKYKLQNCRVWMRDEVKESWESVLFIDLTEAPSPNLWERVCVALNSLLMINETHVCVYHLEASEGFQLIDCEGCREVYEYPQSIFLSREGVHPSEYNFEA